MKWPWKAGQLAGNGVCRHATFLLLAGWVALSPWVQARGLGGVPSAAGSILASFACVVAHEDPALEVHGPLAGATGVSSSGLCFPRPFRKLAGTFRTSPGEPKPVLRKPAVAEVE